MSILVSQSRLNFCYYNLAAIEEEHTRDKRMECLVQELACKWPSKTCYLRKIINCKTLFAALLFLFSLVKPLCQASTQEVRQRLPCSTEFIVGVVKYRAKGVNWTE